MPISSSGSNIARPLAAGEGHAAQPPTEAGTNAEDIALNERANVVPPTLLNEPRDSAEREPVAERVSLPLPLPP